MTRKISLLAVFGLAVLVVALAASSALGGSPIKPSKTAWTAAAPVPEPTGLEGACDGTIGDKIYEAFGLTPADGDTSRVRIYKVPSDTWTFGSAAPTFGRSEFYQGVTHGGTLYCFGGRSTAESWSYKPSKDAWTMVAPEPDPLLRVGAAQAGKGDSIYMFGGRHATGGPCSGAPVTPADVDGTILRYDIKTDTWSPAGNLVVPRTDATATRVGDKIYIFGGCDATGVPLNNLEIYNPKTQTSTLVATPMPGGGRSDMESAAKGGKIHIVGGLGPGASDPASNYIIYDTHSGSFSVGPNVPTHCSPGVGRGELDVQVQGDLLFAIAGACPGFGASINDVDVLKV
jgi:N-acetylneuraminic acid mutarotase